MPITRISTYSKLLYVLLLPVILAACAINDATTRSTEIPITLNAPPTTIYAGNCEITGELEEWLQVTTRTRQDFQLRLDEAIAKNANDVHDDTLYLAALRDTVAATITPDCGVEVQNILIQAMSEAVSVMQMYFNRTLNGDISEALKESQSGMDQATVLQNQLLMRMKSQYDLENLISPTPTS